MCIVYECNCHYSVITIVRIEAMWWRAYRRITTHSTALESAQGLSHSIFHTAFSTPLVLWRCVYWCLWNQHRTIGTVILLLSERDPSGLNASGRQNKGFEDRQSIPTHSPPFTLPLCNPICPYTHISQHRAVAHPTRITCSVDTWSLFCLQLLSVVPVLGCPNDHAAGTGFENLRSF